MESFIIDQLREANVGDVETSTGEVKSAEKILVGLGCTANGNFIYDDQEI